MNITCGIVSSNRKSSIGFNSKEDFIQIDAAANPGSSGGAVVNENGELIGIMSGIFTKQSDANVGVNFAISSELLIETISHLLKWYNYKNIINFYFQYFYSASIILRFKFRS